MVAVLGPRKPPRGDDLADGTRLRNVAGLGHHDAVIFFAAIVLAHQEIQLLAVQVERTPQNPTAEEHDRSGDQDPPPRRGDVVGDHDRHASCPCQQHNRGAEVLHQRGGEQRQEQHEEHDGQQAPQLHAGPVGRAQLELP
ncbi:hypothetical protein SK803_01985 [Lentzea sp. BCCO 10_0856]|uniref:Uncharacterized protein n=1 Tax=Lentzea miocenica TaxID=3095431 RepID=A0ABU4SSS8_9PSEU|nr:hypothetical protein [Lentzea sp. BCCO 10_0856]MDX8028957.1 hypothetical protein [Lentzea sp. BCCO 10_0856]